MDKQKIRNWLIKYWYVVPFLTGLIALVGVYLYARLSEPLINTPLLQPRPDSVTTKHQSGNRTKSLEERIKQEEKARIFGKRKNWDEIIPMDFSRFIIPNQQESSADHASSESTTENPTAKKPDKVYSEAKVVKPPKIVKAVDSIETIEKSVPFFTLKTSDQQQENKGPDSQWIKAVVHGDQQLQGTSYLTLRTIEGVSIRDKKIAKNTIFKGKATVSRNQVKINISRIGNIPVDWMVHDHDYTPGIMIPGKKPVQQSVEDSGEDLLDHALTGVPYGGLARAGRNILRGTARNRRTPTVFLPDGYLVYVLIQND